MKESAAELLRVLADGNAIARAHAAMRLGRLGVKRAFGPLVRALNDPHPLVRMLAAQALGQLGDPRALPALREASEPAIDRPYAVTFREAIRSCERALKAPGRPPKRRSSRKRPSRPKA